jgi:hypothetical protein
MNSELASFKLEIVLRTHKVANFASSQLKLDLRTDLRPLEPGS